MDPAKQRRLEAAGWRVGTAAEFLKLSPEESAYVEMKFLLSRRLRDARLKEGLTQAELAEHEHAEHHRSPETDAGAELPAFERAVGLEPHRDGMGLSTRQAELCFEHAACARTPERKGQLPKPEHIHRQHRLNDRALRVNRARNRALARGRSGR